MILSFRYAVSFTKRSIYGPVVYFGSVGGLVVLVPMDVQENSTRSSKASLSISVHTPCFRQRFISSFRNGRWVDHRMYISIRILKCISLMLTTENLIANNILWDNCVEGGNPELTNLSNLFPSSRAYVHSSFRNPSQTVKLGSFNGLGHLITKL